MAFLLTGHELRVRQARAGHDFKTPNPNSCGGATISSSENPKNPTPHVSWQGPRFKTPKTQKSQVSKQFYN